MMLKNKNAIIYGAGGSLGCAVARAFAKEGSKVFATDHRFELVKKLAEEIINSGGKAEAAEVDALNEKQVNDYINKLENIGTIDISFNAISLKDTQGIPLTDMLLEDFLRPVTIAMETQFITSTAAARVMIKKGSGVILSLTATPGGIGYANVGGFGPACCAIETCF
jgi:3-oxoacyl-[acyl-carrier protein] reductase